MSNKKPLILVIDDQEMHTKGIEEALKNEGLGDKYDITRESYYRNGRQFKRADLIVLDVDFSNIDDRHKQYLLDKTLEEGKLNNINPENDENEDLKGQGFRILRRIRKDEEELKENPEPGWRSKDIIMLSHVVRDEKTVAEYVKKYGLETYFFPPDIQDYHELVKVIRRLCPPIDDDKLKQWRERYSIVVGHDPLVYRLMEEAEEIAKTDRSILILGKTGTGKELMARFIHAKSERATNEVKLRENVEREVKQLDDLGHLILRRPNEEMRRDISIGEKISSEFNYAIPGLNFGLLTGSRGDIINELLRWIITIRSRDQFFNFKAFNCAQLAAADESALLGALFGIVAGSFTDVTARPGAVKNASYCWGTLFLDEVVELSPKAQAMLLRVLQEGVMMRAGSGIEEKVDVRIIAATNEDIYKKVRSREFRPDLYARLVQYTIELPPLKMRKDFDELVDYFWEEAQQKEKKRHEKEESTGTDWAEIKMDNRLKKFLKGYGLWGNIRELKNVIEGACYMAHREKPKSKELRIDHLMRTLKFVERVYADDGKRAESDIQNIMSRAAGKRDFNYYYDADFETELIRLVNESIDGKELDATKFRRYVSVFASALAHRRLSHNSNRQEQTALDLNFEQKVFSKKTWPVRLNYIKPPQMCDLESYFREFTYSLDKRRFKKVN